MENYRIRSSNQMNILPSPPPPNVFVYTCSTICEVSYSNPSEMNIHVKWMYESIFFTQQQQLIYWFIVTSL